MTLHSSLKIGDRFKGRRNVHKRSERIQGLIKDERWKSGDSLFNLPKTKIVVIKKKKKEKEEKKADEAGSTEAAPAS